MRKSEFVSCSPENLKETVKGLVLKGKVVTYIEPANEGSNLEVGYKDGNPSDLRTAQERVKLV